MRSSNAVTSFLPRGCGQLEPLPARGQPDASAAEDELERHQHRHGLADVRRTGGGQRQCGQRHEQEKMSAKLRSPNSSMRLPRVFG
jgi:hypothetical protein